MPTATPALDTRYQSKNKTYPVIVRLRDRNKTREISTGWKIEEKYWKGKEVSPKHPDAAIINSKITDILNTAKRYFADCNLHNKPVRLDLVGAARQSYSFIQYLQARSKVYWAKEMITMSRKLDRFVIEWKECFGTDVYFEDVTQEALRKYEQHLINQGNNNTTRAKKFSRLRELYGNAINEGKTEGQNPFKLYNIQTFPVKKGKLTEKEIISLENLQLQPGQVNDVRNLFLFSYYCKGARFENCVTMKKDAVQNGRVVFTINKGKKHLSVKVHERLQKIIDYYKDVPGDFIFPFVKALPEKKVDYDSVIGSLNTIVNKYLKIIASLAGIKLKLTFHIARHSFAFHLKKKTNSINVIQDTLGHSDQRTTQIYLDALDDETLDLEIEKLYGE